MSTTTTRFGQRQPKFYLPRFYGPDKVQDAPPEAKRLRTGSTENVILVVEDDDKVRQTSVETLRELGYTVAYASNSADALTILDSRQDISLLFTDIVMPGMNGKQLADEALSRQPKLLVLFTTGYTRNAIIHNGVLDAGTYLLTKPFSYDQLGQKVQDILADA